MIIYTLSSYLMVVVTDHSWTVHGDQMISKDTEEHHDKTVDLVEFGVAHTA